MNAKRWVAALCAALLLLGSLAGLSGCTKDDEITPPPTVNDPNEEPQPDETPSLVAYEAKELVDEKLPEGYESIPDGDFESENASYFLFAVNDPEGKQAGTVAIDKVSGERYNYDGEAISEYADFPLYDAATDAQYAWDGVFQNGDVSVELLQSDASSFEFAFSSGEEGVARVKGNTAATEDGSLTFTFEDENTLLVGGENAALSGTYRKEN